MCTLKVWFKIQKQRSFALTFCGGGGIRLHARPAPHFRKLPKRQALFFKKKEATARGFENAGFQAERETSFAFTTDFICARHPVRRGICIFKPWQNALLCRQATIDFLGGTSRYAWGELCVCEYVSLPLSRFLFLSRALSRLSGAESMNVNLSLLYVFVFKGKHAPSLDNESSRRH